MQQLASRIPVCAGVLYCSAIFLVGCGDNGPTLNRAQVSGDVTVNGDPLEKGSIAFLPADGTQGPSVGGTIQEGHYLIPMEEGPVVGTYRVKIRATRKTGRTIEAGPPAPPGTMVEEIEAFIPAKYNTKSALTAEIQPEANEVNYDLQIASE